MGTTSASMRQSSISETRDIVSSLVARARAAQRLYADYTQEQVDEVATAVGWAIVNPVLFQNSSGHAGPHVIAR
jgi:sulfoacetaldehyde dehydrogenase